MGDNVALNINMESAENGYVAEIGEFQGAQNFVAEQLFEVISIFS